MHYILGNPTGDNTETQPVDVTAAPDPPNPIAPVISPPLTSQERRDKYQKVEDDETPFIYDPENPKTPPRKIRKKKEEKDPSDDEFFTGSVKKVDEAGFGSTGSVFVVWRIQTLRKALTNNDFRPYHLKISICNLSIQ